MRVAQEGIQGETFLIFAARLKIDWLSNASIHQSIRCQARRRIAYFFASLIAFASKIFQPLALAGHDIHTTFAMPSGLSLVDSRL